MSSFMGNETEYGILAPSAPALSPIITSTHSVMAYAAFLQPHRKADSWCTRGGTQWDYAEEFPLRDQRGFDLRRYHTVPVIDPHAVGVANLMLCNGARFYVDHAHPEYSSPETTHAWDTMLYDAAGDRIMVQALRAVDALTERNLSAVEGHDPCPPLKIYKNNVDGKGASYGSHENYRYSRSTPFTHLAEGLIPFFVARQIIIGAGRVGIGQRGEKPGFQISQRADYIEQVLSLETTMNRGIINTRDEPHTVSRDYGRLHVIIGDANMSHTSMFLKYGMTHLVIRAIEAGIDFSDLRLHDPVACVHAVSHDLTLSVPLFFETPHPHYGDSLSARDLLRVYWERCADVVHGDVDTHVMYLWKEVNDLLDKGPHAAAHLLDWCAKYALMQGFIQRGAHWDDPKIKLIDMQYSDIDPAKSLYHALVRKGRLHTLAEESALVRACTEPPRDTRAALRGYMMATYPEYVAAANWDSLVVLIPHKSGTHARDGADSDMVRLSIKDLGRPSHSDVAQIVQSIPFSREDSSPEAFRAFVHALVSAGAVTAVPVRQ